MSDVPRGPGWWQASDDRWYPPEDHPANQQRRAQGGRGAPARGRAPQPGPGRGDPRGSVPPGHQAPRPARGQPSSTDALEGFGVVRSLFDLKFTSFVTPRLLRFFYGFVVVVLTIGAVGLLIACLVSGQSSLLVVGLIVVPVVYLLQLMLLRVWCELIGLAFRIADDVRVIRRSKQPG